MNYWLAPIKGLKAKTVEGKKVPVNAEKRIQILTEDEGTYAVRAGVYERISPGDEICFYATGGVGIVAYAEVASKYRKITEEEPRGTGFSPKRYAGTFTLKNLTYLRPPIRVPDVRCELYVFKRKKSPKWSWFVRRIRTISKQDFDTLTGRSAHP